MRMLVPMRSTWPSSVRSSSSIFDDFDRLVDSLLQPTHVDSVNFQPACDINETKDHYLVSFDMPGVSKNDVRVEVKDKQLFISGERSRFREEKNDSYLRSERNYGRFQRTFRLPETVNADKIEAHHQDGVLEIMLPKAEVAKGRTIEVQSGKSGFFSRLLGDKKESTEIKDVKAS